ncbi:MAG: PD-(D/E)XK nuclease family protein [Syntrophorhabdaceae bacterium]
MPEFIFNDDQHLYTLDERPLPSVTGILKSEGFIDDTWFTEDARLRGTYVHMACHLHDMRTLDEDGLDDALRPYLDGYIRFKAETGFTVIESEIPRYHPQYLFAGTPDKIGMMNNSDTVIDLKSGILSPWTALQTAAYELFFDRPMKRFGVQLTDEGKYKMIPFTDRTDRNIFLSALACRNWKINHGGK